MPSASAREPNGGTFRPCSTVFRYTTLVAALKSAFGTENGLHAVARFRRTAQSNRLETLTYAPRDRGRSVSIVPLQIEYLADVDADLFVLKSQQTAMLPRSFDFAMGAMRSKGFGRCTAERVREVPCDIPHTGTLCFRVPDLDEVKQALGIRNVLEPRYGYLFVPESLTSGTYVRSLFEGSRVAAYDVLLQPEDWR